MNTEVILTSLIPTGLTCINQILFIIFNTPYLNNCACIVAARVTKKKREKGKWTIMEIGAVIKLISANNPRNLI